MNRWDAILLDFDDTIADTAQHRHLRDGKRWGEYFGAVANAEALTPRGWPKPLVAEVIDSGIPWAVVTNSPSAAPRRFFDAQIGHAPKVTVAYHDTESHKPNPEPFLKALDQLGIAPSRRVLAIGDEPGDVVAAARAGITAGSTSPDAFVNALPDVFVAHPSGIRHPERASRLATAWEYPGESFACFQVQGSESGSAALTVGGRYDVQGEGVSRLIQESKNAPPWPKPLIEIASNLIGQVVDSRITAQLVTIPSRGRSPDRFAELRTVLADRWDLKEAKLQWARETMSQRMTRSARERRSNMADAFTSDGLEPGSTVIVLDDVRTSGETLNAAASAIRSTGGVPHIVALTQTFRAEYATANPGVAGVLVADLDASNTVDADVFRQVARPKVAATKSGRREVIARHGEVTCRRIGCSETVSAGSRFCSEHEPARSSSRRRAQRRQIKAYCQKVGCSNVVRWNQVFCPKHDTSTTAITQPSRPAKSKPGARQLCANCGEDYPARWTMCGYCGCPSSLD